MKQEEEGRRAARINRRKKIVRQTIDREREKTSIRSGRQEGEQRLQRKRGKKQEPAPFLVRRVRRQRVIQFMHERKMGRKAEVSSGSREQKERMLAGC